MALPTDAVAEIERFRGEQTPPDFRDEMRIEAEVEGAVVTLSDCRPWWDGGSGEWTEAPFAQLRYNKATQLWTLCWGDRDDRRHRYEDLPPSKDVAVALAEIAEDPASIFFG